MPRRGLNGQKWRRLKRLLFGYTWKTSAGPFQVHLSLYKIAKKCSKPILVCNVTLRFSIKACCSANLNFQLEIIVNETTVPKNFTKFFTSVSTLGNEEAEYLNRFLFP